MGWQDVMALHVGVYAAIVAMVILERKLPFWLRAGGLVGLIFIKGIAGLITWGLTGFGITSLIVGCILCTVGFGVRAGVVATAISLICTAAAGAAFHLNYLTLGFDPVVYLNSRSAWAAGISTISLSAGVVVIALGSIHTHLVALIHQLDQRNGELEKTNRKLEEEILAREKLSHEKAELQSKLHRAQKMEVVATVAGGVAHDLNNVLSGAVSYPDLLCTQLPPDSPLRGPLEKIKKSGLKAAAIVSDLLALVRRGIITKKTTNINFLISEYLKSPEFERMKFFHPGVVANAFLDDALWNIQASPVHILKAVMNLVSNGAEAMSGEGELTVTTRNVTLHQPFMGYDGEIPSGEYVVLEVADTGTGMGPEEKERVFEPFYSKKALGNSGTGLGMTVVWGAVKDHGGHIELMTAQGHGTCFRIFFPASREAVAVFDYDRSAGDYTGNGEKILVIDDVIEQRDVAVALLTALGYTAIAVPTGEAAVRYLQKNSVDLVILDMIMDPGMDGLDTYREIVKQHPSQKAIIATGYCETDRMEEARKLGAGNSLMKPFTLEKLGRTVRSELEVQRDV